MLHEAGSSSLSASDTVNKLSVLDDIYLVLKSTLIPRYWAAVQYLFQGEQQYLSLKYSLSNLLYLPLIDTNCDL